MNTLFSRFGVLAVALAGLAVYSFATNPGLSATTLDKDPVTQAPVTQTTGSHTLEGAAVAIQSNGTFSGLSKHVTTGGVTILKTQSGYLAILESDFSLDGAPAPTLGFGNDGKFDTASEFTKLENISGAQLYQIPASINPANFNEFYVWCADFSVPLGVAKLNG